MGGASVSAEVEEQARRLGAGVAERGWVLLNGGRGTGVMQASAEGAQQAGGLVVGVLPSRGDDRTPGGVAEGVDVAVFTGLGEARNNVNVLSSDVVVALPGGAGTLSEAALAVKTGTPVVLVGWEDPPAALGEAERVDGVEAALRAVERLLEQA